MEEDIFIYNVIFIIKINDVDLQIQEKDNQHLKGFPQHLNKHRDYKEPHANLATAALRTGHLCSSVLTEPPPKGRGARPHGVLPQCQAA